LRERDYPREGERERASLIFLDVGPSRERVIEREKEKEKRKE
jgi:hypothetical protein